MNHRELHNIIANLSGRLTCPHCKARITSRSMRLINVFEKDCTFQVICPQCAINMTLGAHLDDPVKTANNALANVSTNIYTSQIKDSHLLSQEMTAVHRSLENFQGSFEALFKNQNPSIDG